MAGDVTEVIQSEPHGCCHPRGDTEVTEVPPPPPCPCHHQFQFVNSYLSLFYIGFYLKDMERLKEVRTPRQDVPKVSPTPPHPPLCHHCVPLRVSLRVVPACCRRPGRGGAGGSRRGLSVPCVVSPWCRRVCPSCRRVCPFRSSCSSCPCRRASRGSSGRLCSPPSSSTSTCPSSSSGASCAFAGRWEYPKYERGGDGVGTARGQWCPQTPCGGSQGIAVSPGPPGWQ